jgi:hypothetical protein
MALPQRKLKDVLAERKAKKAGAATAPAGPDLTPLVGAVEGLKQQFVKAKAPPHKGKPPVPVDHTERIETACGHGRDMPVYANEKPENVAKRRARLVGKRCPECAAAEQAKQQADAAAKRKARGDFKPGYKGPPGALKERLPHLSKLALAYDASKVLWSGSLTVPHAKGVETFQAAASSLRVLLSKLDNFYRRWAGQPDTPAEEEGDAPEPERKKP